MLPEKGMLLALIESPWTLAVWLAFMGVSLAVLVVDLRRNNAQIVGLMKWVWVLTVAYSGPVGLAVYYVTGRRQIARDSVWRRAWRSVSHCYSGCGGGEIAGVFIFAGLLSLGNLYIAVGSFVLAYIAGYALTVGPLVQQGVAMKTALVDAFVSESASITVMEVTAIGLDLWLAQNATMGQPLFWNSLILSLTAGLFAAYPVNVYLISKGVKEGMHDPRKHHDHGSHDHGTHSHAAAAEAGAGVKNMIGNPAKHFDIPQSVVEDPDLSTEDKLKILESWEHDARELSVAAEENMSGGERPLLKDVEDAMRRLGARHTPRDATTKLG